MRMRTILFVVIMLAIVAALVVDGFEMYVAHRTAVEVAKGAAEQAAKTFVATKGSEAAAEEVVEGIADEAEVQLVAAAYHKASSQWYEVTVRTEPDTYFLRHLPFFRDYLAQESTAVVHF
jgi:type II secretory pathway pseudopilin PulG